MKSSPKREKNQVLLPYESHVITSLRVRHGLWQALKLKCIAEGLTLSDEVERLIDRFVEPEYISLIKRRMSAGDASTLDMRSVSTPPGRDPAE